MYNIEKNKIYYSTSWLPIKYSPFMRARTCYIYLPLYDMCKGVVRRPQSGIYMFSILYTRIMCVIYDAPAAYVKTCVFTHYNVVR